jgi:hypothetical protein
MRKKKQFFMVGERPSQRAIEMGVCWRDGRLSAKTLHAALEGMGYDPAKQIFRNLYPSSEPSRRDAAHRAETIRQAKLAHRRGLRVVGMGKVAQAALREAGVPHLMLRHPAARGLGRRKPIYWSHCFEVLMFRDPFWCWEPTKNQRG